MIDDLVSILLVEDDTVDVRAITRAIRKKRINNPIVVAQDGIEALELLRKQLPRPYLVLLDLNLPRLDGLGVLEQIRDDPSLKDSIVFVLTTSNDDADKAAAYDKNIAGYLVKNDHAGEQFINLVSMLESFVLSVQFPPGPKLVMEA